MIEVRNLGKEYVLATGLKALLRSAELQTLRAVDDVSFDIAEGEVLGLVGESGCGKSTTGRMLVGLDEPTRGSISFDRDDATTLRQTDRKAFHRRAQMIFQDPYGSLNPQHTIGEIVTRPLVYQGESDTARLREIAADILQQVGLAPAEHFIDKFPHQISGGQRQRVCIARAIVLEPTFLVADEPISMLDVSIKWGIIRLLKRLVRERGISLLYITHDLATVGAICDRIAIMYLGRIVETGPVTEVLQAPRHPYTAALVSAVPNATPDAELSQPAIKGAIPDALHRPSGCRFAPRCPRASRQCEENDPSTTFDGAHGFACFHELGGQPAPASSLASA